ncbi:MAG TPA: cyclic nucleotide-binding domain-containing protein [Anaerolineae bacterium]|nr:cyclic nucleotide-binding domain-containing protein [Anaerolineae bacterium]
MASSDLQQRLSQFWLLADLDPEELQHTAGFVHEETAPAGRVLFRQGEVPTHFYLLESGVIEESGIDGAGDEILHRRAEAGDYVGRWGMLQNEPRRATATVVRDAKLLAIENEDFQTLLAMVPRLRERLERKNVVNRLLAIPLFAGFDRQELANVADLVREVHYPADQTIFAEGDEADAFYVIDMGQVEQMSRHSARSGESWPKFLTAGNFFGRHALMNNTTRRATARATTEARLFRFSAEGFHWLRRLNTNFDRALTRPDIESYLRGINTFKGLNETDLRRLAGFTGLAHLRPGDTLYRQGEIDPTLYVLYRGEAIVRERDRDGRERPRSYLKAVQSVGESSLFLQEPRDVTVVATTDSDWCYLTRPDLDRYLNKYPEVNDKLAPREEVKARTGIKPLPWMEPTERLVLRRRRHWFFLANKMVGPVLVLLAAAVLALVGGDPDARVLTTALALFVAVVGLLWAGWALVDWLNDYYVVTTMRVAHREKTLLIRETRDEAPLDKVQNVNLNQDIIGNYLGFGRLVIETAAAVGISRVSFNYVPEPATVQQTIFQQMQRVRAGEAIESQQLIREKLESRLDLGPRLSIPRPVIPAEELPPPSEPPRPGISQRLGEATWKQLLWVEHRESDRVTWRKHWLRLLSVIWLPALALVAVLALLILYVATADSISPLLVFFLIGLGLVNLFWLSWNWANWGNDLYIVTNDRIIDTERLPLGLRSKRTETTFDKIQNVSFTIPGPIATLFNFGTVTIFTAGAEGKLDFSWVKDPRGVQREIFRRIRTYEERQRRQRREEQWEMLPEWFAAYDAARRT